jgi:hypothetical protein
LEALILATRKEYGWGAKKLLQVLTKLHPAKQWPARSIVNDATRIGGLLA